MKQSKWIWYPGDFELYHSMLLHNRRRVLGVYNNLNSNKETEIASTYYYPMWRVDGPRRNCTLYKKAKIEKAETIELISNTDTATLWINGKYHKSGVKVELLPGEYEIKLKGFKDGGFPCFYVKGETFASDESWRVLDFDKKDMSAGYNNAYNNPDDNPEIFNFLYKRKDPVSKKSTQGGVLYDFGRETFGKLVLKNVNPEIKELLISLGETEEEATDIYETTLVLNAIFKNGEFTGESSALRYAFIPSFDGNAELYLDYEYLDIEDTAEFKCDIPLINKIWDTCVYTLHLNMREGFFDGIKRDRWVWSGDAYQSYFVNYYLTKDTDTVRRTIRMLRGTNPMTTHINTITDYTFYWICSIWDYYFFTGDKQFVADMYPDMLSTLEFIEGRLADDGMYTTRNGDWVFIDWSTFDKKEGPICAEQMLLCHAYTAMAKCASLLSDEETVKHCNDRAEYICSKINELYWDEEKGAFVDDYTSGRRNVTRHANIFALLFDLTSKERQESIIKNVIYNKNITPITTPYFEFYELDAMCKIGDFKYVTDMLHSYWGGMINLGATTIWEEFDPTMKGAEHYAMYGEKYGKSLCHAWGASPIYLLGKYALGVCPTSVGYATFDVCPNLMCFKHFEGKVPVLDGEVSVKMDEDSVTVCASKDGGTLVINGKKYKITKNIPITVSIK
ncbi:MAG: alpha-rhamnosidase [Clostridia bacterium]|nr:alpha-rhamnosidase [Clostridia bacterium]